MGVTATAVLVKRPAHAVSHAGLLFYKLVRIIAWPAAWLCYGLEISSNIVTCTRFLSPLAFLWLTLDNAPLSLYLVAVAFFGYTDAVDGVLAGPDFEDKPDDDQGAMLDPLADKFFVVSIYLFHYANFPKLVILTAVGEAILASLALSYIATTGNAGKMRANMWGKTKLCLEVITAGLMTWFYATRSPLVEILTFAVGVSAIFFLTGSLYSKVRKILP